MKHFDFTTLYEWASGRLENETADIRAHLDGCGPCREAARQAVSLFSTVRSDRMAEPPAEAVSRAVAIVRKARPGRLRALVETLRATLVFDSLTAPLPVGVRSARLAGARRLLYEAESFDIDLSVEKVAVRTKRGVRGQILARSGSLPGGIEVQFARAGGRAIRRPLDPHGEFFSGPLLPGYYTVTFEGDGIRVIVDAVEVN